MRRPSHLVLLDGSLSACARAQHEAAVNRMAADLVKMNTFANERDAIRSLFGRYRPGEIMTLLDDAIKAARQIAAQEADVAREMARS